MAMANFARMLGTPMRRCASFVAAAPWARSTTAAPMMGSASVVIVPAVHNLDGLLQLGGLM